MARLRADHVAAIESVTRLLMHKGPSDRRRLLLFARAFGVGCCKRFNVRRLLAWLCWLCAQQVTQTVRKIAFFVTLEIFNLRANTEIAIDNFPRLQQFLP